MNVFLLNGTFHLSPHENICRGLPLLSQTFIICIQSNCQLNHNKGGNLCIFFPQFVGVGPN